MYAETLARHAAQLTAAGVDFIVTDQTNISEFTAFGDAIQLRPFEVVLEEWRQLRDQGFKNVRNLKGGILAWIDQVDPSQMKY
jgi:hypothetical protein